MPFILSLKNVPTAKLVKIANEGYVTECIELACRYLFEEKNKTDEALKYLNFAYRDIQTYLSDSSIKDETKAEVLYLLTKIAVKQFQINTTDKEKNVPENELQLLREMLDFGLLHFCKYAPKLVANDRHSTKSVQDPVYQSEWLGLLNDISNISNHPKFLEQALIIQSKKGSALATQELKEAYENGKYCLAVKPKRAIFYSVRLKLLQGENRSSLKEDFIQDLLMFAKTPTDTSHCLIALVLMLNNNNSEVFKLFSDSEKFGYELGWRKYVSLPYPKSEKDYERVRNSTFEFLLKYEPYATVDMVCYAYKVGFIDEPVFNNFLNSLEKNSELTSLKDKLRYTLLGVKYTTKNPEEKSDALINVAKAINNVKYKSKVVLNVVVNLIMELCLSDESESLAKAKELVIKFNLQNHKFNVGDKTLLEIVDSHSAEDNPAQNNQAITSSTLNLTC